MGVLGLLWANSDRSGLCGRCGDGIMADEIGYVDSQKELLDQIEETLKGEGGLDPQTQVALLMFFVLFDAFVGIGDMSRKKVRRLLDRQIPETLKFAEKYSSIEVNGDHKS